MKKSFITWGLDVRLSSDRKFRSFGFTPVDYIHGRSYMWYTTKNNVSIPEAFLTS